MQEASMQEASIQEASMQEASMQEASMQEASIMHSVVQASLRLWLKSLNLPRQPKASWHRDRLREELQELRLAKTHFSKLSEASDVIFSITRAQHDGFASRRIPFSGYQIAPICIYMLAKFTSRWFFFKVATLICMEKRWNSIREVVNPSKDEKVASVACRHQIDPEKFQRVSRGLRRVWPLLP
ncbi:hypothetical protein N7468_008717 [Penicillium chermesinum]|uniref:Uncharacterized protein n=1 Tax=Penicillium chermesinum TaxID=63820 RepID=A0A9W9TEB2_9EURO|nr:uncharacterized protein N7468_008717 [Penicillium chermesinum]KAJ5219513.1 hypothetical protein N7468_008717 [Penicillium chermesinum]